MHRNKDYLNSIVLRYVVLVMEDGERVNFETIRGEEKFHKGELIREKKVGGF